MMVGSQHCVILSRSTSEVLVRVVIRLHVSTVTLLVSRCVASSYPRDLTFTCSPLMPTCHITSASLRAASRNLELPVRGAIDEIRAISLSCLLMVPCIVLLYCDNLIVSIVMLLVWLLLDHLLILMFHVLL